jgi:hypothetical protein
MANKYIALIAGKLKEIEGLVTSAGAGDAGKIPALDSTGRLDSSVLPAGTGGETLTITASENLTAGEFVNVWLDSGNARVRKADASNTGKEAHGFVLANVTSGNSATVYYGNINNQRSGLTIGSTYYLSGGTAGSITTTPPSTSGHLVQRIGVAYSATEILVELGQTIELA